MAAKLDLEKARSKSLSHGHPFIDALQWHIDEGIDVPLDDAPVDRRISSQPEVSFTPAPAAPNAAARPNPAAMGALAGQKAQAADIARNCATLDALKAAIAEYEGLDLKRTATNLVFADGSPNARVMVIGEAPATDEDRQGLPFAGATGQLLDKMFECINLKRHAESDASGLYLSNILNWRPPGNRTPTDIEISLSLAFIERHIALARPDFVVLMGGLAAKTLLNSDQTAMSRLRGKFYDYQPITPDIQAGLEPCTPKLIATYHPAFLLLTPAQKRQAWQDLQMLRDALKGNNT